MQHILSDEELEDLKRRAHDQPTIEADRSRRLAAVTKLCSVLDQCGFENWCKGIGYGGGVSQAIADLRKEICT